MSSYCSEADIVSGGLRQAAVDELTDLPGLITNNSALIDSYLRGRYELPLSGTPVEIRTCCVKLTLWDALQSLGWDPEKGPDESIRMGYKDALDWLKMLASGKVNLDNLSDATPSVNEAVPRIRSNTRNESLRRDGRI